MLSALVPSFRQLDDGAMRRPIGPSQTLLAALAFVAVLLVPPMAQPTWAQSSGEGSIYSRFGLGSLSDFSASQSQALGGGAYALRSLNYNPDANPSLWSDQVYTRLSGSVAYKSITVQNDRGETGRLTSGTVQAVQFSFPLIERELGVGISFQPYSRSNYSATKQDSVAVGPFGEETAPFQITFRGSGGLHKLRGGLGYRFGDVLSVGATVDLIFGIIESQRQTSFTETAVGLQDALLSDGVRLSGVTGSLGSHMAFADVFSADDALSVGAAVTLPAELSGLRYRTLDEDLARDTLSTQRGEVSLPWRGRLGMAYQPNTQWTVVADGLYEPWSSFTSTFSGSTARTQPSRFPVRGAETLTNRWRLSAGAEVVPAGDDELRGYLAQVGYRLGAYMEQMYIRPDLHTNLRTYAVTAGLSLPTSLSGTRVDFNVKGGTRGTTSNDFVRDTFYGLSLHVNFGERWFQQRKLR